jgi:hypothetical protein
MTDLQAEFRNGHNQASDAPNPHYKTSNAWEAFELGRYFRATGRPYDLVRASRGSSWRGSRDTLYSFTYAKDGTFKIERVR